MKPPDGAAARPSTLMVAGAFGRVIHDCLGG